MERRVPVALEVHRAQVELCLNHKREVKVKESLVYR